MVWEREGGTEGWRWREKCVSSFIVSHCVVLGRHGTGWDGCSIGLDHKAFMQYAYD